MQLKFHCHVFAVGDLIINFYTIIAVEVKVQQKVINLETILSQQW
jgi:hypothetical protein